MKIPTLSKTGVFKRLHGNYVLREAPEVRQSLYQSIFSPGK